MKLGFAPNDRSLAQMLAAGELDALVTARTPSTFRRGGGPVRRLFDNPWQVERDYFRRTRLFPIMHTAVIKSEVLDENPWVAVTLTVRVPSSATPMSRTRGEPPCCPATRSC